MPSPSSGSAEDTFGEFTQVTSAEDSVRGMRKLRVTPIGPGPAWDMLVAVADGHPWLLEADAAQEAAAAKAEQVKPGQPKEEQQRMRSSGSHMEEQEPKESEDDEEAAAAMRLLDEEMRLIDEERAMRDELDQIHAQI